MARIVTIEPVTRIEGHAKVTIHLDDAGKVTDARMHVTEFRGFEKFCEGRSFWEMPGITARICGICPVSHAVASAKAGDAILGVQIPPTARKLRLLVNWAELLQSHALSFFYLSGPDLLLGFDSDPAKRNVMGLIEKYPDVARNGVRLRQLGQEIIRTLGGKSIHTTWIVPGGVREPLTAEKLNYIKGLLPEHFDVVEDALNMFKDLLEKFEAEIKVYGKFPSLYMGLVSPEGAVEHYDGLLRIVDSKGKIVESGFPPARYREIIGEAIEPWSYLKFPYYKPYGYEGHAGMYQVGSLARINVSDFAGSPRTDREIRQFRRLGPGGTPVCGTFYHHYARLIGILYALEKISETLEDPEITSTHVRSMARVNQQVGIGASEAPRGTLFHEYHVDENGILQKVNLLIATGQNNLAMNKVVLQIAQEHIKNGEITEGVMNRIEHGIRSFDPCLSCSTHAVGKMPLHVQMVDPEGNVVNEVLRG